MSEANPYQPPESEPALMDEAGEPVDPKSIEFSGGKLGVAGVAVGIGLVIAGLLAVAFEINDPVGGVIAYGAPALGLVTALGLAGAMLQNTPTPLKHRVLWAALLALPAYILFVPTCVTTAMVSTGLFGANGYGPTVTGLGFATVLSFTAVLLLFALAVRGSYRRRARKRSRVVREPGDVCRQDPLRHR